MGGIISGRVVAFCGGGIDFGGGSSERKREKDF